MLLRSALIVASALLVGQCPAQEVPDTSGADHWVAVDLKTWAWYLNFTHEQKVAVRAIDARYAQREAELDGSADYVDTEAQRERRRALVKESTAEVQAALEPARFARWLNLRNGATPVKPNAGGTVTRWGIGVF